MADLLTPDHFSPYVERNFRIRGGRHVLSLARMDIGREEKGWPRQPFNLIFHGPAGDVLAEGLYTAEVDDGPAFELYLIPIHTPARDRQDYQSAFN
jgi:uncharacterized protein DUF6916